MFSRLIFINVMIKLTGEPNFSKKYFTDRQIVDQYLCNRRISVCIINI